MTLSANYIIAFLSAAVAALLGYCVRLNKKMSDNAIAIATLQAQVQPLWMQVQARIASDLHHDDPIFHETDGLIEKLQALTITPQERDRLKVLLTERSHDMHIDISREERQKARVLIEVMDLVVIEAKESQ
jgi:hypothetical protein